MIREWHRAFLLVLITAVPLRAQTEPGPASEPASQPAPAATQPSSFELNPVIPRAAALIEARQPKAAHDVLLPWLLSNPKAPGRDRALFLMAEVYYQEDERFLSYYQLDELLDNFPESKLYFQALEFQYRIADDYLNGYKDRFLGLRIVGHVDEAIEMLYRIQDRSPGSPIAERSLRRTADYYFNDSQFDLAGDAYGAFIRIYPRSPQLPQVRLRQAFSSLAQFRGPKFDATPLIDAKAQFKEVQTRYPDLAAEANVAGWIDRIDADLARKVYTTGQFYEHTDQPGGAAYMYRYLIANYPASKEAKLAADRIAKLPKSALVETTPPPGKVEPAGPPVPDSLRKP